ncbi:MAG: aminotransferase class V-fold PLP-dependent enzyme [Bryobacteraceae bacterium]
MTSRRFFFQNAAAWWPFSSLSFAAKRTTPGIYAQLGIRPLINFQGTMTTIGASKMPEEVHAAMAEASRDYVFLEEVKDRVGERIAKLCGTEAGMVSSGAAGAIAIGTYACLTGEDNAKVRQLPDLTGMKSEVIIQKRHRNGYDHAVRSAGVKIIDIETREQLANAINSKTAMMYFLGGTSHDWEWETPISLEQCLEVTKKAGVPVLIDAANMLPPWSNIHKVSATGVDLIAVSGGKHIRGPQSAGILAGRKDLIRAAWLNSSPHSDSQGRGMKVNREEMVGLWVALERYAKLDFDAIDKECERQASFLMDQFRKIGLTVEKLPFDRSRRVHRVHVTWDEAKLKLTAGEVEKQLRDGEPRIVVLRGKGGLEFTVFMNDPGDEKIAARRMKEIFAKG